MRNSVLHEGAIEPAGRVAVSVTAIAKSWRPGGRHHSARSQRLQHVFSNVSFTVSQGEIFCILGENGAGKTTLLKCLGGLARPDCGRVSILDERCADGEKSLRIAYAGGERSFYQQLTIRENLSFFGALDGLPHTIRASRTLQALRDVDLLGDIDRRVGDLSTGMRQRLSVARALLTNPGVLLLDEPTRGLDPQHAASLRRFLRETLAKREGKAIIVATNLVEEALELGDRVAVLCAGRFVFADVRDRHEAARTIRMLLAMNSS